MKKRGNLKKLVIFGAFLTMMLTAVLAVKTKQESKACSYFKRTKISKCVINIAGTTFDYTGAAITPNVNVNDVTKGYQLVQGTDYILTYKKNVNEGIAKAVVKGKGNYRGKKTIKFNIVKKQDNNNQNQDNNDEQQNQSVEVNVYKSNDNADDFIVDKVAIESLTPTNLVEALKQAGSVAQGVQVLGFRQIETNLILDLSSEFKDDINNSGTAGEYIKVGCVVNSFLDAYNETEILITVEGEPWESGHTIYDNTLTRFESNVSSGAEVNVYTSNDNADGFIVNTVTVESIDAQNLINALIEAGSVAQGVEVLGFRQIEGNLILDLSSEFRDDVNNSGTAGEYIKVGCVVNTFLDAFNETEILITVEGEPWESGHAVYDNTLTRYN